MPEVTADLLKSIAPQAKAPELWAPALQAAAVKYSIADTPQRLAMWLAQGAHETMGFSHFREIWGPTPAQERYEGRKDLGNIEAGDGFKYRGRGIFQLTGRANYAKYGQALGVDLAASPERAEEPEIASEIAGLYWKEHDCNWLADNDSYENITRKINGGLNGWPDRVHWLKRINRIFNI